MSAIAPHVDSTLGNWNRLREARQGVALHYDGSANDRGAESWLTRNEACKVSYHRLVLDGGQVVNVAPDDARAWAMGPCRPSSGRFTYADANSAFYSWCVAARPGDTITEVQRDVLIALCVYAFQREGWPLTETWRITDHASEAWPRGRKVDIGTHLTGLTLETVRAGVLAYARVAA